MEDQQGNGMSMPESSAADAAGTGLPAVGRDYILVALDLSPHSEAALAAAAELAAALQLELRGVFVEDVSLLHLCGFSFGLEIGSLTAKPRRLEQRHLEREFQLQATLLRKIMAEVAGKRRIQWSFQVLRGAVTDQLLAASAAARMMSLGRVGRSPGKRTGSTAQAVANQTQRPVVIQSVQRTVTGPYTVIYTGSAAAANAVALAVQLANQDESAVDIVTMGTVDADGLSAQLAELGAAAYVHPLSGLDDLLVDLHEVNAGTVILPTDAAVWLDEVAVTVTVVVVP